MGLLLGSVYDFLQSLVLHYMLAYNLLDFVLFSLALI